MRVAFTFELEHPFTFDFQHPFPFELQHPQAARRFSPRSTTFPSQNPCSGRCVTPGMLGLPSTFVRTLTLSSSAES
jgi:hypothetical protein